MTNDKYTDLKSEGRRPKAEGNPKPEGRMEYFGFDHSDFIRHSSPALDLSEFVIRYLFYSLLLLAALLQSGCATSRRAEPVSSRPFDFQRDTFAYSNQLTWVYGYDAQGKWTSRRREPKPDYTLHCFVVARSAEQFFVDARFDPSQPLADEDIYRRLIRRVVKTNLRRPVAESEKTVIPGYADLRAFSGANEKLLKAECGSALQGYFQRGNWRMIFPFSRRQQEHVAERLVARLQGGRPLVVHLARFPQLTINHAVMIFHAAETRDAIQFSVYDPNDPSKPSTLTYDRGSRTFLLPANQYFPGGRVDVYEVYCGHFY